MDTFISGQRKRRRRRVRSHSRFYVGLLVAVLCTLFQVGESVRFHLPAGTQRCFTDDLPLNRKILGEVKLSNGRGNSEVDVKISTLQDNILYQRRSSNPGKFSFHTPSTYTGQSVPDLEAEDIDPDDEDTYQFCVHHYQYGTRDSGGALDKNRLIEFKWKAVPLDGYGSERSRSAKKMSTDTLQLAMNEMRNELLKITKELSGLQQRERVLVKRNEKAAKHVVFYAVLSILVAGGVSAFQVHYFQRFFKARKIL